MPHRYLAHCTRCAGTMLAGGIALKLLVSLFPTGTISPVGAHYSATLGALTYGALRSSMLITARGLALALPLSLLLGLLLGLRPGSRIDRILKAPLALLAGLPALPMALTLVCALTIDLVWLEMNGAVHLALGLAICPWLTLAIRNAIAALAAEGHGIHPVQVITATLGAILTQSGQVILAALAIGVYLVPDDGLLRLLELGSRMSDPVLLYMLLVPTVPIIALLHLAGGSLLSFAGADLRHPAPVRPSRLGLALGALLTLAGLSQFAFALPDAGGTWLIALGATAVAAFFGIILSLLGPVLPRPGLPSYLAPVVAGLILPVLLSRTLGMQMLAIGAGCALTMAHPLRRLLNAADEDRRVAWLGAVGAGLVALSQAFAAELTLGIMNVGLPAGLTTLGRLIRTSLLADANAQAYPPTLLALATASGLFLLGLTLTEAAWDGPVATQPAPEPEQIEAV